MAWILVPCLVSLRAEFNALAPDRDKASDGSIGDGEHSQNSSDHNPDETGKTPSEDADDRNEVHAIDVDATLRRDDWSMERAVSIIVTRHRTHLDDRLQNVIYNRRIWSRSWGWTARAYTGANPHDKHAHFSARYTTAEENDTRPWGLLEADVALSDADWVRLTKLVEAQPAKTWKVGWGGELAETRLANASAALRRVDELGAYVNQLAADELTRDQQDAERDAGLPGKVVEALGAGQSPEQVAAALRQVDGVDWAAVGRALTQ